MSVCVCHVLLQLPWSYTGDSITLKWPNLAATCVLGTLLGATLGLHLLRHSTARRGFFTWGLALLWYALMCAGALVHHCLDPLTAFYLADVASTGCSSACCLAGLAVSLCRADDTRPLRRTGLAAATALPAALALWGPQLAREQVYLAPTVLAAALGLLGVAQAVAAAARAGKLARLLGSDSFLLWFVLSGLAACLGMAALPADRYLCAALGSNGGSFLPWTFLGCDLFFLCAFKFVVAGHREDVRALKGTKSF